MKHLSQLTLTILLSLICLMSYFPSVSAESSMPPIKVVYHIDDAREGRFALEIAADQLQTHPGMQIAMVAYGGGIDFLLKGANDRYGQPYAPAIQALAQKGVDFKVCSATLKFREIAHSQVLDGMEFVPGGTYEIIRLQAEEGYVYLKP